MRPTPIRHIPEDQSLLYLFPPPGRTVRAQREILLPYVYNRDGRCWVPGCKGLGVCSAHEGIVTRGDVQGWDKGWRCLIHTVYNSVWLCHARHHETDLEPSAMEIAEWMVEQYTRAELVRWLECLPFKQRPAKVREILRRFDV